MDEKTTQQNSRRIRARYSKCQQRDQGCFSDGIVCTLRCRNSFRRAFAEFLGRRDHLRASLYDMKDATVPPAPGITPSKVPMMQPRDCGKASRLISLKSGNCIRARAAVFSAFFSLPAWTSSSLMANKPTMTITGAIPDRSSGLSKVKRLEPATGSVPIVAIIKPSSAAMNPLIRESPDRVAITLNPRTPRAK